MGVLIDLNHPICQVKDAVASRCDNFFTQQGFSYFQYLRCYQDGSFSLLTNNTGLLEEFSSWSDSPVIFSSFEEENKNMHTYWFFWDDTLPSAPVNLARDKYNLNHGLTLVRRSKEYYDMIAVALPKAKSNIAAFYLNKQKAIENFINNFDRNNQDLLQYANKNMVQLTEPYRDTNYQNICLKKGRIFVNTPNGKSHLTTQEIACIRWMLQGASTKEIANILAISPRTVESYFLRIKDRTGVMNKLDFQSLLLTCT